MQDDPRYRAAKRHVEALKGLYIHALVFALVMTGLLVLNLVLRSPWWVHWPLIGWGVALVLHAIAVYGQFGTATKAWEEKKIKALMERQ